MVTGNKRKQKNMEGSIETKAHKPSTTLPPGSWTPLPLTIEILYTRGFSENFDIMLFTN